MKRRTIIDRIKFKIMLKGFKLNPTVYKYNKPLMKKVYKMIIKNFLDYKFISILK